MRLIKYLSFIIFNIHYYRFTQGGGGRGVHLMYTLKKILKMTVHLSPLQLHICLQKALKQKIRTYNVGLKKCWWPGILEEKGKGWLLTSSLASRKTDLMRFRSRQSTEIIPPKKRIEKATFSPFIFISPAWRKS